MLHAGSSPVPIRSTPICAEGGLLSKQNNIMSRNKSYMHYVAPAFLIHEPLLLREPTLSLQVPDETNAATKTTVSTTHHAKEGFDEARFKGV